MIVINESAIAGIISEGTYKIEQGVRKVYERTGRRGQGIEVGMREISEGMGSLHALQSLMNKAYTIPQKMSVNYGG